MRIIALLFILVCQLSVAQVEQSKKDVDVSIFDGSIGNAPIHMELSNVNGEIIGWYQYPGKSTKLRIEGTLKKDSTLELNEFTYKGEKTGHFLGRLEQDHSIFGTWNNPDYSKHLHFRVGHSDGKPLIEDLSGETPKVVIVEEVVQPTGLEKLPDTKVRRMLQPSKVKGYSKLALWTTIGLLVILVVTIFLLTRSKKTALKKQQEMFEHTKKQHYGFEHSAPESSTTKTAARIGYEFEKFVVDLFPTNFYKIKFWTSDKSSNNHVCAESNQYPDLLVELTKNGTKYPFAVECKYRTNLLETGFEIGFQQLSNYRQFESENDVKVFIAIGIAGSPTNPKDLFVIPLSEIRSTIIPVALLKLWYRPHNGELFFNEKDKTLKIWNKSFVK